MQQLLGHHQRILATLRGRVVARAPADLVEAKRMVEGDGARIARPHLEKDAFGAMPAGQVDQPLHQPAAESPPLVVGCDAYVEDVALAGGVYFGGYPYLGFIVGWTGGYVLVNSLMAPYLRKFGCYTVPDFIGTRYGGNLARLCAVIVLVVASFTYVTAQINATGTIAAQTLGVPFEIGVYLGLLGIFICSMLGGMRGVTWTQVAQYIVLIVAYLLPLIWMSNRLGYGIIPHFSYGDAVHRIGELEAQYGLNKAAENIAGVSVLTTPANAPEGAGWKMVTLAIAMMTGTNHI